MIKLEENEKLIKVFRKHWLVVVLDLLPLFVVAIVPLFLFSFLRDTFFFDISLRNAYLVFLFYSFFFFFFWIVSSMICLDFYLDIWVLTDKSLIDVEQKGLFSREISNLRLDNIQDIKVEVSGILNTLLHIGDIHVQTASTKREFVIYKVSEPNLVKELINKAYHLEMERAKMVKIEV